MDFSVRAGQIVFLTGGNGSGKTTLAKLLTGLYAPTEGEILVDGRLLGPQQLATYRNSISAIWSEGYVFTTLGEVARSEGHDGQRATPPHASGSAPQVAG